MGELFSVKEKVVVITGGTGVLGSTIAEYLASQGAKIVILGRNKEAGNNIADKIKKQGNEAIFLQSDVLDKNILTKNHDEILEKYSKIDALINAAGGNMPGATIAPEGTFFDLDIDDFDKVLRLNLTGTVLPTQIFLNRWLNKVRKHHQYSSMAAFRPTRVAGYAAAKLEFLTLLCIWHRNSFKIRRKNPG